MYFKNKMIISRDQKENNWNDYLYIYIKEIIIPRNVEGN